MTKTLIGDICSFYKGASVSRDGMIENGDYLYLHYGDLYKDFNTYIDINHPAKDIPFISSENNIKDDQFVDNGDIIYILTSETVEDLGKALMIINADGQKIVSGMETTIMRINDRDIVNPSYLNYILQMPRFKLLLQQYVTGMKVFRVHPRDISRIPIDIPSMDKQNKIVDILYSFDKKIELNTHVIKIVNTIVDTIFKEIYTKSNYVKLDEVVSRVNEKVNERNYPVFSAVKSGDLVLSEDHFKKQVYSKNINKYIVVKQGDFAFNPARVNIGSLGMNKFDFDGCVSPVYVVFCCANAYRNYLDLVTKTKYFNECVAVRCSGSVRQALSYDDFKQIEIPWPSEDSIQKFNENISSYLSLIKQLEKENIKLADIRDSLLPKLMSGKIEV